MKEKLKLKCDLLRDDKKLSKTIYSKLDSSCTLGISSVFKSSIFGNIFPGTEKRAVFNLLMSS